jgi:hypothetical protein
LSIMHHKSITACRRHAVMTSGCDKGP